MHETIHCLVYFGIVYKRICYNDKDEREGI